jgi:16S rRNA pseudouridine516 synthase
VSAVRLDKLLANLGYGSRREIAMMARAGRIALDDAPLLAADARLALADAARLIVAGKPIDPLPGLVLMLNKPLGVTCSHKEAGPLVYDLLPERWRRRDPPLSSVGRLDKDTSGLLLITDDGALLHRIIAPRASIAKRYRASLARPLRGDEAAIFAAGTLMLDGETRPLLPAALEPRGEREASVTIVEGRYHQVRRMFAALGNHVEALRREAVGGLALPDDSTLGEMTILDAAGIAAIFAAPAYEAATDSPSSRK